MKNKRKRKKRVFGRTRRHDFKIEKWNLDFLSENATSIEQIHEILIAYFDWFIGGDQDEIARRFAPDGQFDDKGSKIFFYHLCSNLYPQPIFPR